MITCVYCSHECPDNAQICPNCGKPLFRLPVDDTPDYDALAQELLQESERKQAAASRSQKHAITAACAVLLLALVIYSFLMR
jgi:uncharacterized membrane protein YvbJ